jgi:hypothetical protein
LTTSPFPAFGAITWPKPQISYGVKEYKENNTHQGEFEGGKYIRFHISKDNGGLEKQGYQQVDHFDADKRNDHTAKAVDEVNCAATKRLRRSVYTLHLLRPGG